MILVDTCILSSLAKIDRLDLLDILFKKHFCYITPSVLKELDINKVAGFGFIDKIEEMVSFNEAKNKLCILAPGTKELEQAYRLSEKYKLSVTDCECIVLASGFAITCMMLPLLPFFIVAGIMDTSLAPAARSSSIRFPST